MKCPKKNTRSLRPSSWINQKPSQYTVTTLLTIVFFIFLINVFKDRVPVIEIEDYKLAGLSFWERVNYQVCVKSRLRSRNLSNMRSYKCHLLSRVSHMLYARRGLHTGWGIRRELMYTFFKEKYNNYHHHQHHQSLFQSTWSWGMQNSWKVKTFLHITQQSLLKLNKPCPTESRSDCTSASLSLDPEERVSHLPWPPRT